VRIERDTPGKFWVRWGDFTLDSKHVLAAGHQEESNIVLHVIFVHGVNTRGPEGRQVFQRICHSFHSRSGVHVTYCAWGDDLGARLKFGGASIPRYDDTKSLDYADVTPLDAADLWELLEQDPLFELRILALEVDSADQEFDVSGIRNPTTTLQDSIRRYTPTDEVRMLLDESGITVEALAQASRQITDALVFTEAGLASGERTEDLAGAWSRAVVARLMRDNACAEVSRNALLRDRLATGLEHDLTGGEQTKGFGSWLRLGLSVFATRFVQNRRGRYTDLVLPSVGDILVYQGHGQLLRNRIREYIPQEGHVVLLGHSLGGVACVDLLAEEHPPKVDLVITVGSQAPFFYEIGALQRLPYEESSAARRLPASFPAWLNIYDPRDFLSFVAKPVFPEDPRVFEDVRVNNRQPFPKSHSAYWDTEQVWQEIFKVLPQ
jgi:hypothetical protein